MHEVRVYYNRDEGTRWWAEDDLGFTGGADELETLLTCAREWAESEGVLRDLEFRLVGAGTQGPLWNPRAELGVEISAGTVGDPSQHPLLSDPPVSWTLGAATVRVGFITAAA